MKTKIILLVLFLLPILLNAQLIQKAEYFYDTEPGVGLGTQFTITAGVVINLIDSLNAPNLNYGFHTYNFRIKDSVGNWGFIKSIPFYIFGDGTVIVLDENPIQSLEYFIDKDNGIGTGVKLTLSKSDSFNLLDSLINQDLEFGYHTLNIRLIDSTGNTGFLSSVPFYVFGDGIVVLLDENPIQSIEYFIDKDNGIGIGTKLTLSNSDSFNLLDSIINQDLEFGYHTLNIRLIDSTGFTGFLRSVPFYVYSDSSSNQLKSVPIVSGEYFIGKSDPGIGNGNSFTTLKSDTLTKFVWNPVNNLPIGPNKLNVRFKDSLGVWGYSQTKSIAVCEVDGPEAGFDYISFGNEITFIDTSRNATKWIWDFGDNNKDSISSPKHIYDSVGLITVKLKVSNQCGIDSISSQISIAGLQTYSPNKGGNSGKVTIILYGVGFTDSTVVKLLDSTQSMVKEIEPDTLYWYSSQPNIIKAVFNLNNKPLGVWDLFLDKLNDRNTKQYRKSKAFTIELGEKPDPYIDIIGNSLIRRGVAQTYNVTFGNRANIDASGTVFFIALKGDTTLDVSFDFEFAMPDTKLNYDSLPKYFTPSKLNGNPFEGRVYPIYIPLIQANSNFSVKMKVKTNSNVEISGWANPPMFSENLSQIAYKKEDELQGSAGSDVATCIINYAMDEANNYIDEAFEVLPGYSCANTYIESWKDIYNYNTENYIMDKPLGIFGNLLWNISKITADCIADFVPAGKYKKITDFVKKTVEFATEVQEAFEAGENFAECASAFTRLAIQVLPTIEVVNSFDPNEKCGPGSGIIAKWIRSDKELSYSVLYENKSTATAAAQVVIIYDTLSKEYLDLSTFQLRTFECANVTRYVPSGLKEYSTDIDLRPDKDLILRINGKLDTVTGIARWEYISLDPQTMSLTEDPILGFLNPNLTSPEGEGKVTYTIHPKDSINNDVEIRNKAQIIFDANEPILTNEWKVKIDNVKPQSMVTLATTNFLDTNIVLKWSSNDDVGEVLNYNIYVSINNRANNIWLQNIDTTSSSFTCKYDTTYKFSSIAIDYAGNIEDNTNLSYLTVKIENPVITTDTLAKAVWCIGDTITVPFTTDKVFYNDNKFTLQLSDKNGSFANPTPIDTLKSQNSDEFTCIIPRSIPISSKYRVRVVSSSPVTTGSDNGSDLIFDYCGDGQQVSFKSGWNIVSSYVAPEVPDSLQYVTTDLNPNLVIMKNAAGKIFMPSGLNQIGIWEVKLGYQAYMIKADTLGIIGTEVVPENTPVYLNNGWSIIPYLRNSAMSIETALASITDAGRLVIVKRADGKIYMPGSINQIGTQLPGEGYQAYLNAKDTLIYPPNAVGRTNSSNEIQDFDARILKTDFANTGNNASLILNIDLPGNSELAVMNKDNKIVGAGRVVDGRTTIVIWGDDESTNTIDGSIENNELRIMNYDAENCKCIEINNLDLSDIITGTKCNKLTYNKDAVLIGKELTQPISLKVNPNPFSNSTEVVYELANDCEIELSLYNLGGMKVLEIANGKQTKGTHKLTINSENLSSGTYNLILKSCGKSVVEKVVVVR